jgi:2'-5' RNA ligase superfamily
MENTVYPATSFTADGLYEYLLIASPDKAVSQKVMEEKQQFFENYQQAIAIKTKPHITLSNFLARDEMEDTLIRWLQRIVGEQRSFPVTLNNYSGIPAHTVFLRVQDPTPFRELAIQLQPIDFYIKSNACPPVNFISYPHLSIARRLPERVYEKAIMDYAQKLFNESFEVTELVLLRRQHQYDACKQVAIFRLQPGENYSRN